MHYSAWLARRWDDPAFPMSFPWFGSERYWGDQVLILREQIRRCRKSRSGCSEAWCGCGPVTVDVKSDIHPTVDHAA